MASLQSNWGGAFFMSYNDLISLIPDVLKMTAKHFFKKTY